MNYKQPIGLHLRLKTNIIQLLEEAQRYHLKYLQFFLTDPENNKYIKPTPTEIESFLSMKKEFFSELFIHSSYWVNPATGNKVSFDIAQLLLKKEIALANKLEIKHIVLHAGSATSHAATAEDPTCKMSGIQSVASMLNTLLKEEEQVQILLENTAHGNKSIGSDINDFVLIKKLLHHPEKVGYCIDFAHAYAYGYDLANIDTFIDFLDSTIGLSSIKLIHLNDSAEECASKKDKHALPGYGHIGKETLQKLINHPRLKEIPKIIEAPISASELIPKTLQDVFSW